LSSIQRFSPDPAAVRLLERFELLHQLGAPVVFDALGVGDRRLVVGVEGLGERVEVVVEARLRHLRLLSFMPGFSSSVQFLVTQSHAAFTRGSSLVRPA
jgi:hypothetical protein